MNDEGNNSNQTDSQQSANILTKKAYHTPVIKHYGSLAELVQANPSVGGDGQRHYPDCTRS